MSIAVATAVQDMSPNQRLQLTLVDREEQSLDLCDECVTVVALELDDKPPMEIALVKDKSVLTLLQVSIGIPAEVEQPVPLAVDHVEQVLLEDVVVDAL